METTNQEIVDGLRMQNSVLTKDRAKKYMGIAYAVSKLSKDSSTKVGAIIIGQSKEIRSVGYNGSPRRCEADEDSRRERPEKLYWFSHAELNAITNAARVGTPLEGSTLLVTHPPCMDCARAICQAGIKQVIAVRPTADFVERWHEHMSRSRLLFEECGVLYMEIDECAPEQSSR